MMRIAGMMRVRNESRWIARSLASLKPLCNAGLFVFDDRSTDDTAAIARSAGAQVINDPFDGLDETRDKNHLVRHVFNAAHPQWIVHIDGDESLEASGVAELSPLLQAAPVSISAYALRVIYLWDSELQMRIDGVYSTLTRPSIFRTSGTDLVFRNLAAAKSGFHCGNIPSDLHPRTATCSVRLKHFGYIDRELRLRKYAFYNANDPNNDVEDRYRHAVQGDLPEVPANARLRHAGPLTLAPYLERGVR